MQIEFVLNNPRQLPLALTIGNFDGVHIGHQAILTTLVQAAKQQGYCPAVMTFSPHAKIFFSNTMDFLISSEQEKTEMIAKYGVEFLYQIPFNQGFSEIEAVDFVNLLIQHLNVKYLLVGDDFQFGYQGKGNFSLLSKMCAKHQIIVEHSPTIRYREERVSSSRVRKAIKLGDFALVRALLGRPLCYLGSVIKGKQLGRHLAFPTANIRLSNTRLLPRGVFAVQVYRDNKVYAGMCNIGVKPTVDNEKIRQIEVHLFNFDDNLYDEVITVELIAKIREEQKFSGIEALTAQLKQDKLASLSLLGQ
ncbi:MAG: riboflavin biosynthesis protein RibF [Ostreibacterium sp.]